LGEKTELQCNGGNIMPKDDGKQDRSAEETGEPITANATTTALDGAKKAQPIANLTPRDQTLYGAAPLLPYESEQRYCLIQRTLEPAFGGHLSRFEHHLRKEMGDSIWGQQRWEQAAAAITNRLARQLMETAAPSSLIDYASVLSGSSSSQLLELPAPQELPKKALAQIKAPPPLRALALVMKQATRALLTRRSEREIGWFYAAHDLWMEIRERRAQLASMDQHNALAQVRLPNSPFEPGAEKITPNERRKEQVRQRRKTRVIYADRATGWTEEGKLFLSPYDFLLRGECPRAFANLFLDVEEYFGVDWPGDALIAFQIAKETWIIRRLKEAAHQILLMAFDDRARKYLGPSSSSSTEPDNHESMSREELASALVRELEAAGSGPNVVLAEALEDVAAKLAEIEGEIDGLWRGGASMSAC
jgi:hypothetical protein